MPWIKYRWWDVDGLPARKAIVANHEYDFMDTDMGICFVKLKKDAEYLIRHESNNYAVAWEKYGVEFDEFGVEIDSVKTPVEEPKKVTRRKKQ